MYVCKQTRAWCVTRRSRHQADLNNTSTATVQWSHSMARCRSMRTFLMKCLRGYHTSLVYQKHVCEMNVACSQSDEQPLNLRIRVGKDGITHKTREHTSWQHKFCSRVFPRCATLIHQPLRHMAIPWQVTKYDPDVSHAKAQHCLAQHYIISY